MQDFKRFVFYIVCFSPCIFLHLCLVWGYWYCFFSNCFVLTLCSWLLFLFYTEEMLLPLPTPPRKASSQAELVGLAFSWIVFFTRLFCQKLNWASFSYHKAYWKMEGRKSPHVLMLLHKSLSPSWGSVIPVKKMHFSCQKLQQSHTAELFAHA